MWKMKCTCTCTSTCTSIPGAEYAEDGAQLRMAARDWSRVGSQAKLSQESPSK
jgi:hypothetical protein